MDRERARRVETLYESALAMESDRRAAFLDESCAGDDSLRREVESLIRHYQTAGSFLEIPAVEMLPGRAGMVAGERVSHYQIGEKLGEGGMGVVYKAHDIRLGRPVALKFVRAQFGEHWEHEARAVAAFSHPHIATLYDIGQQEGAPYLVMEYVPGQTLAKLIPRDGLPLSETLRIAVQVADGLARAHCAGIVHRDLKPANIMVTDEGQVKLLDFGLAQLVHLGPQHPTTLTVEGEIAGTPAYMSPEQARGLAVDCRSDIFSFGAVLYEMASGQRAFPGSMPEAFAAILGRDPTRSGDTKLDAVIRRALRKNPAERYQSASEVKAALEALQPKSTLFSRRRLMYGTGAIAAAGAAAVATRTIWAPSGAAKHPTFAVVLIENLTGDPSLDWMDRGLCELLVTAMAQSQALAVLSTEVVRAAAAHRFRDNDRLAAERAQDVARDTHADLYASGALLKLGPGFRLILRAQETKSGRVVYTGAVEGADAQALFGMTDQAAAAMLAQIAPHSNARLDSAGGLTSNLEALRAYTEAGIYLDQRLLDRGTEEIKRAVVLDPEFAMAQSRLATFLLLAYNLPAARAAAARAVAISERRPLPRAHLCLIQSTALYIDGRLEDGLNVLETARKEAPQDWEICDTLSDTYWQLGRFSEAISTREEAARLNPNAAVTYLNGAYTYAESGDLPKALQFLERYASLMPVNPWYTACARGDILTCNEHYEEALEQYRIAEKIRPTPQLQRLLAVLGHSGAAEALREAQPENQRSWLAYRDIQIRKGDLDGALAFTERMMRRETDPIRASHWPKIWNTGNLLLEQREPEQALALAKRLPNPWSPGLCGAAHLILGDEIASQADFAELRKGIAPIVGDFMTRTTESLWRIRAASCMGRYGEVADLSSQLTRSRNHARWAYSLDLVRALLALGHLADAEAELTWLIRLLLAIGGGPDTWVQFSMLTYLLARFHLGQVRERTGRRAGAAEWYRFFLSSFAHSTAKLPQIAEAQAALKRL